MHSSIPFFFILSFASAASALTVPLSGIPSRVRAGNPSLKAARLAVDEARGRQLGAGRLANPSLESAFQSESAVSPMSLSLSLDQSFPLTRRLSIERKLSAQMIAAAELEARDAERRIAADAASRAVKILALDQQRSLRERQRKLAAELAAFTQGRAEKGELSPLDAAQAQLDSQRIALDERRIAAERVALIGELKPMLGLSPNDSLTISGGFPALAVPGAADWKQRPDFQLAQAQAAASQTEIALAKSKRLQDASAGVFAAHERQDIADQGRERTGFAGVRFSIPIPLWNKNEGEIAEKSAAASRRQIEADALASQIASEADTARREMQAHLELARETRDKLLPLVIEQSQKLQKAYEQGQTELLAVLRSREQQLQIEAAALDAERDFHLARIRRQAATGTILP